MSNKADRPIILEDFIGQSRLKENLDLYIKSAKIRNASLDHVLFYGPPGLGKTTLAHVIANEMGTKMVMASAPNIKNTQDLAGVLTKLEKGDVLFVDEIHRLSMHVEESIYSAMEDFSIDIIEGKGQEAESKKIELPDFTLIGATTKLGNISDPLRDRFGIIEKLDFYSFDDLGKIALQTSDKLGVEMTLEASKKLGVRARGTPRIVKKLTKRTRDFAIVMGNGIIDKDIADTAMTKLKVDESGLNAADKRYLEGIVDRFNGGPVGVEAISAVISEEPRTIKEVYEPFLLSQGFIDRTKRGRIVTEKGYQAIGR
ncbi:MAG: Holliday junction branch migration DNA helicase RuvB [Candidatus Woesearchaeota archaeon]